MTRGAWRFVLAAAVVLGFAASVASAACRQALALGLDVSGSVDGQEYRLQIEGLARALTDPDIRAALLANPAAPVDLAVFEWSGATFQRVLSPWTTLRNAQDVARFAESLRATKRGASPPETAIGSALRFGAKMLGERDYCWKRTLDISGDGKHNSGPHPRAVRDELLARGVTVNALVIGVGTARIADRRHVELAELTAYFRAYVIAGPDAFIETALGFKDYETAMKRKLLRELQSVSVASRRSPSTRPLGGSAGFEPVSLTRSKR